ncbi:hypothetical protein [Streptoalloteichus tenebrarius]|uniref:hypothetical protein n=1 Tax=Streptoalloteichus tenebrarius (strain ATCC 17920 / DSM 40477 / JCM 4838 / CBS 697.72 / NBRC 16177 / NCIMB 11028 / NRRL B-12390 / A12253. 1 / ISP 5477) TaxID=1933 RepID=UPI0020A257F1|nr:hypothetical protein [Streptoalloteichus tenebrarius]
MQRSHREVHVHVAGDPVHPTGTFRLVLARDVDDATARPEKVIADLGVELGPQVHRGYPHILLGRDH